MSAYENISVMLRIRPPNKFEEENSEIASINIQKNKNISVEDPDNPGNSSKQSLTYDYIFNMKDE